ncbi:hypothetical protein QS257_12105 [Terrilactibacillus sp. S3-3]|nr:hypothetical protein QS257_12105 [Terrilactibacillus sp. S3-3]
MQVAQSGLKTIRQSEQQMQRWLDDLQLEGDAKENRIQALTRLKKEIGQDLKELPIEKRAPEIDQHIDEWFFYIKKRLVQRYIDEFSQFFNPALFFEQTRSNKEILYQGLKDCMEFLSFDLDQECRAAFLRVEALLKKELSRLFEKCESITAELSGSAGIAAGEPAFGHPALPEHLKDIDLKPLTAAFKFYKNPKQFFEKDGKKLMRDDLQERLEPYLTDLIEKNSECTKSHYLPLFYSESGRLTEAFKKQADQAADYTIKMLQADHQPMIAQLENARQDLTDLLAD